MPYDNATSLIAPYLRPMYLPAIEGIKDAQTQGRWEQVQDEEKRRWEANRPFVDAQAKQMQFSAKKAEEAWNLYNSVNGGQGDGKLAALGIDPKEFTRAYLGINPKLSKVKVNIPELGGETELSPDEFFRYQEAQAKKRDAMPTVYVPSARKDLPANVAFHYPDFQKPEKGPAPHLVYRTGPDGKPYAEFVTPQPGRRVEDVYKPQAERGGYTQGQIIDDNRSYYDFKGKALIDPTNGRVIKGKEAEYQQLLSDYQADLQKIAAGQKPSWFGGTTAEQDRDQAFLEQVRTALGGKPAAPQQSGPASAPGGSPQYPPASTKRFEVSPEIDKNRPAINNPDGSISTEETVTIEWNGKFYLIPTIVDGKRVSPDEAVMAATIGKNKVVGEFDSQIEADVAARLRSAQIGQMRNQ